MKSAIVFAYHNVGVRCLKVLLAHNIQVKLVITHKDNPNENIWFESVEKLAKDYEIPTITPEDINQLEYINLIKELNPDFIFSFYYRNMICLDILGIPKSGAFNMHGSLLPKYRGRVPVNWAIIHGETETGATLHYMTEKPDQGDIVAQESVPILPEDNALTVFHKVTWASERALNRVLPDLISQTHERIPQDNSKKSYYSGRKPKDSEILWNTYSIKDIYNLIRAVAEPYPSAFCEFESKKILINESRILDENQIKALNLPKQNQAGLFYFKNELFAQTIDNGFLKILNYRFELN